MNIRDVFDALREIEDDLTAWELEFMDSIEVCLERDYDLTIDQRVKLFEIYEERI
jgi:hypothetical protein